MLHGWAGSFRPGWVCGSAGAQAVSDMKIFFSHCMFIDVDPGGGEGGRSRREAWDVR